MNPGDRIGDYEILAELGAGGMGHVYRARHLILDRLVALKTLSPHHRSNPHLVERFLKEARAAARLNHPNIVQIYDFGQSGDLHYLTMEYIEGESLQKVVNRGPLPEARAIELVRIACNALGVAHAAGLVHRDVKPDNLMLARTGELKLVDLGVAKQLDEDISLTQTGQAIGTPHYISPEQIRGEKKIDGRADLYSLGATLFHLLTGKPPFRGETAALIMSMHLYQPVEVSQLSPGVGRVIRKLMEKDPALRYPDAAAAERDLAQLGPGAAAPPPASASPANPAPITPNPALAEASVKAVEVELGRHVGPMARVLVKRAARTSASLRELIRAVEGEIEDAAARRAFRAAVDKLR